MKVYLDHASTTPLHPKALEKMLPFLKENFGNPSSVHSFGRDARVAIEEARETIASAINANPSEIYFTSGGTEANNFAVSGIAKAELKESKRNRIITGKLEHSCIFHSVSDLSNNGFLLDFLTPKTDGTSSIEEIDAIVNESTCLVTLIHTNNETGAVNDIQAAGSKLSAKNIHFHTDAVQAFGKTKIDVKKLNLTSLSASAHKINGPKGIGFTFIKSGAPVNPIILGGSQERNRRGGTENVAAIAGFSEAVKLRQNILPEREKIVWDLKNAMIKGLNTIDSDGIVINSSPVSSPYILSVTFDSRFYNNDIEAILFFLDINGIAASNGAACSSGTLRPSRVIIAMGKSVEDAKGTIRFSFGIENNLNEIEYTLDILKKMSLKFRK